jgi:hypothetical protein
MELFLFKTERKSTDIHEIKELNHFSRPATLSSVNLSLCSSRLCGEIFRCKQSRLNRASARK